MTFDRVSYKTRPNTQGSKQESLTCPNRKSPNAKTPNGKSPNFKSPNTKRPNTKRPNLKRPKSKSPKCTKSTRRASSHITRIDIHGGGDASKCSDSWICHLAPLPQNLPQEKKTEDWYLQQKTSNEYHLQQKP